jgi:membrane-associated phospholipid phosphatase
MDFLGLSGLQWMQSHVSERGAAAALGVSTYGEAGWLWFAAIVLFWCFGAKAAYRTGFALALGLAGLAAAKVLAHVPRPWVRWEGRVEPVAAALPTAGGWSFPSGHVAGTALAAGGLAGTVRRWWGWVLALAWIAAMGWSRLALRVHTGWDVAGGLLLGLAVAWLAGLLHDAADRAAWRRLALAAAVAAGTWWFLRKHGGEEDLEDVRRSLAVASGFFAAWAVERTWIRFSPSALGWWRLPAALAGLLFLGLLNRHGGDALAALGCPPAEAKLALLAFQPFFAFAAWPFAVKPLAAAG